MSRGGWNGMYASGHFSVSVPFPFSSMKAMSGWLRLEMGMARAEEVSRWRKVPCSDNIAQVCCYFCKQRYPSVMNVTRGAKLLDSAVKSVAYLTSYMRFSVTIRTE
jgi:hypothetical protein